jgi:hypothetical protein
MILVKRIVCTFIILLGLMRDITAQIQMNPDSSIGLDQITVSFAGLQCSTCKWLIEHTDTYGRWHILQADNGSRT